MTIWAISDLHLAFGVPSKTMEVFGPEWKDYAQKIQTHWKSLIKPEDLVLIPGDLSWGMRLEEALVDLQWIDDLPGTKVIIRGNHDYWWSSSSKMSKVMPPSIHFITNNAFHWQDVTIGGARLWDTPEYSFSNYIVFRENPFAKVKSSEELAAEKEGEEKIFQRELERLKLSLKELSPKASLRIALTHYPPIGANLEPSRASQILEEFRIDICIFGHLHNIRAGSLPFGQARSVKYLFTSCDYLGFQPLKIRNC